MEIKLICKYWGEYNVQHYELPRMLGKNLSTAHIWFIQPVVIYNFIFFETATGIDFHFWRNFTIFCLRFIIKVVLWYYLFGICKYAVFIEQMTIKRQISLTVSNVYEHLVYIVFNGAYYSLVEFSIHTFTKGVTPAWFPVVIQFLLVGFLSCHAYVTKPCNLTWCSFH